MTDSDNNLIYKTRAVEGTLAWFDVLDADDCRLLRVQVDLSRRYWVIYRYGIPSFPGQLWDETATERLDTYDGARRPLFRRACITVSWARYHAVVDMYEPAPPTQEETEDESKDGHNNENLSVNLLKENGSEAVTSSKRDERNTSSAGECNKVESSIDRAVMSQTSDSLNANHAMKPKGRGAQEMKCLLIEDDAVKLPCSSVGFGGEENHDASFSGGNHVSPENLLEQTTQVSISDEQSRPQTDRSTLGESIRWVQSKALESVAAPYRPANREEGMITLNNPVLKVQEINSIVGQHQTMLIRKEEARQLKREELLIEAKLAKENLEVNGNDDLDSDDEMLKYLWYEYSYHTSESEDDDQIASNDKDEIEGVVESNLLNVSSDSCLEIVSSQADDELALNRSASDDEYIDEQPLVGYWTWQNSIRVHRMKMHLAKSSDLALHVILSVITNQLRYERHATVAVAL